MNIDYENCKIYFTKEEVSVFDLSKPIVISGKREGYSSRPYIILTQQLKGDVSELIKEETFITIEESKVKLDSVYFIQSFEFVTTLIGTSNQSFMLTSTDKGVLLNIMFKTTNIILSPSEIFNKTLKTPFYAYNYTGKYGVDSKINVNFYLMEKPFYPLYHLKNLKLPIQLYNYSRNIAQTSLKTNPLFIGYYTKGDDTYNQLSNLKLLSIHKWREYWYHKSTNSDKWGTLFTDPTINTNKVLSKMFDNYTDISNLFTKLKDLDKTKIIEVTGKSIVTYYNGNNYLENIGSLSKSCMKNHDKKIDFYANNPNCYLAVMLVGDKVAGRAIIWNCIDGSRVMDRIYTCYDRHENLFIDYCRKNNIQFIYDFKTRHNKNSTGYGPDNFTGSFAKHFKVSLNSKTINHQEVKYCSKYQSTSYYTLPYFDNFNYIDIYNNCIANYPSYEEEDNIKFCYTTENYRRIEELKEYKGAYYDKNDFVTTCKDEYIPSEFSVLIKGNLYHVDDTCFTYHSTRALKEECVTHFNRYIHKSDLEKYNNYIVSRGYKPIDNEGKEIVESNIKPAIVKSPSIEETVQILQDYPF